MSFYVSKYKLPIMLRDSLEFPNCDTASDAGMRPIIC